MTKAAFVLTAGLLCFFRTSPENHALANSANDFGLSGSSAAYSGGTDKNIVASPVLGKTTNTDIYSLQTTAQTASAFETQNRSDKELVLTTAESAKLFSSSAYYSKSNAGVIHSAVSLRELVGNTFINSSSSLSNSVSSARSKHDFIVSLTFPAAIITPEIAPATSLSSGIIFSRSFSKDNRNSQTQDKFCEAFQETGSIISFTSLAKNLATQVQASRLSNAPSILVEISDFKHDPSIIGQAGNKMFTKVSDLYTELAFTRLRLTIWESLTHLPKASLDINLASHPSTKPVSYSSSSVDGTHLTEDISGISRESEVSERTIFPGTSRLLPSIKPSVVSNSSRKSYQGTRIFSLYTGNTRNFSVVMASPAIINKNRSFSSQNTETISKTLSSGFVFHAMRTNASMETVDNAVTMTTRFTRALYYSTFYSSGKNTSYQSSDNSYVVTAGESVSRVLKNSSLHFLAVKATSVQSSIEIKSLDHQRALTNSSKTARLTLRPTTSLSPRSRTPDFSTQMGEREQGVLVSQELSNSNKATLKLDETSVTLSPKNTKQPWGVSLGSSAAYFSSSPVQSLASGVQAQKSELKQALSVKQRWKTTGLEPWSYASPTLGRSNTQSKSRNFIGSSLSQSLGGTRERVYTASYSQAKITRSASSLQYRSSSSYLLPPVTSDVSMVTSGLNPEKQKVPSSVRFGVMSQKTQVFRTTVNVLPPPFGHLTLQQQGTMSMKPTPQPTPTETSSATVAGNASTDAPPTTASSSSSGQLKLLVVVAIVPSVVLCVLFAVVLLLRRNRKRRNTPCYSIKVEYLDEKKFRKRCVNSRLDLSLKGIHIDLEFPSVSNDRRESYPRDIALFSRGTNLGDIQMRDFEEQEDDENFEWSNGVIVRVTETSLNSRAQSIVRDSVYSLKEKDNYEPSEKVVRRESSKKGRECVKWRIPVVQRRESKDFDQRFSQCTDDTSLFVEDPTEEPVHETDKSTDMEQAKNTYLQDQMEKAFKQQDKEYSTGSVKKDTPQEQLSNRKLDEQFCLVKENKDNNCQENKLTVELNSRKEEQFQQDTSSHRPRFKTL